MCDILPQQQFKHTQKKQPPSNIINVIFLNGKKSTTETCRCGIQTYSKCSKSLETLSSRGSTVFFREFQKSGPFLDLLTRICTPEEFNFHWIIISEGLLYSFSNSRRLVFMHTHIIYIICIVWY